VRGAGRLGAVQRDADGAQVRLERGLHLALVGRGGRRRAEVLGCPLVGRGGGVLAGRRATGLGAVDRHVLQRDGQLGRAVARLGAGGAGGGRRARRGGGLVLG